MKRLMFMPVFVGSLLWCASVRADESIGLVLSLEGAAVATDTNGTARVLELRAKIFLNDIITTGVKSKVEILFRDDTRFSQGENSEMTVDQYVYNPGKKDENKFGAKLKRGIFRTITGKIPLVNQDGFTVKTSRSTIGIRGCELGFFTGGGEDKILIITNAPGRQIVIGTPENPQGQMFDRPCVVTVGGGGSLRITELDSGQIDQLYRETASQGSGSQKTGVGAGGGWNGQGRSYDSIKQWVAPGDKDLPATGV
ncbi:MAG: FecR domain-containing protein [Pontiellaceae bacterium]|nr:FecR domain-containing protein [Pontiellaceae bacterium]